MKKILISTLAYCSIFLVSSPAVASKIAKCKVTEQGQITFLGKCRFESSADGSFSLSNVNPNKPLVRQVSLISLFITQKNVGEVRGLHSGGNSRWGTVTRSLENRACWVAENDDFEICAW